MSEKKQSELISLAEKHFGEQVLPLLREPIADDLDKMVVYVTGSVAAGFCDELSDVDIEMYSVGPLSEKVARFLEDNVVGDAMYEGIRMSYGMSWQARRFDLLREDKIEDFWSDMNPYLLFSLKHLVALHDENDLMEQLKSKAVFYPEDKFVEVVRGLWITASDSGEYNSKQSNDRHDDLGRDIYLHRGIEALLRLIYVLNGEYYPPTKWLFVRLEELEEQFGVEILLDTSVKNFDAKHEAFKKVFDQLGKYLIANNILEKECVEDYSLNFSKPRFTFCSF